MDITEIIEAYGFEVTNSMTIGVSDETVNTMDVYSLGNFDIDVYGNGENYMCWIGETPVELELLIEALNNTY